MVQRRILINHSLKKMIKKTQRPPATVLSRPTQVPTNAFSWPAALPNARLDSNAPSTEVPEPDPAWRRPEIGRTRRAPASGGGGKSRDGR